MLRLVGSKTLAWWGHVGPSRHPNGGTKLQLCIFFVQSSALHQQPSSSLATTSVSFTAQELTREGTFQPATYQYSGETANGWHILRNGQPHLQLGPGYQLLRTICSGICSTDLARQHLPYPLPQIIGHEVAVQLHEGTAAIEINASHLARGHEINSCAFCKSDLAAHCPGRWTLGINTLPGSFAPWILAPVHAAHVLPRHWPAECAALLEPLAAALQSLNVTPPGSDTAVFGPRRLGGLLLCALAGWRKDNKQNFSIHALSRNEFLRDYLLTMGADECLTPQAASASHGTYDVVYDTSGSAGGFLQALSMTRRILHLKSTHGQPVEGLSQWAAFVVDELSLLPYADEHLHFCWPHESQTRQTRHVHLSPRLAPSFCEHMRQQFPQLQFHQCASRELAEQLAQGWHPPGADLPRLDAAILESLAEMDEIVRPLAGREFSIVRPRGVLLLAGESYRESSISHHVRQRRIAIHSSRCGNFAQALNFLKRHPQWVDILLKSFVTRRFALSDIAEALQAAADPHFIKVLLDSPL